MKIPVFKEKTVPVYEMEHYINNETSVEGIQLKHILTSIKEFEAVPRVEEMASLLEYEEKAIDYAFRLAINTLHNINFEPNYLDIANAVLKVEPYSTYKNDNIALAKYLILEQVLEEIKIVMAIKQAVQELNFKLDNNIDLINAIKELKEDG